ncbi:hypothetical protein OIU85_004959 [Salix viminalis]|uniref:Uncharacterized protein n=1 Tax=Salix viminalis TaxID=40686 RepID=A0A9Q0PTK2_SALVM|nr:hypothetical protein OIU85_004959 [Salix viminalis]
MAANLRPNLAFGNESIIMQHGVFALLVETLNSLIQVKYQTTKASPFDSHDVIMSVLLAALFTYICHGIGGRSYAPSSRITLLHPSWQSPTLCRRPCRHIASINS